MARRFQPTEKVLRPAPEPAAPVEGVFGYVPQEPTPEPEYYEIQGFDEEDVYIVDALVDGKMRKKEIAIPIRAVRADGIFQMRKWFCDTKTST